MGEAAFETVDLSGAGLAPELFEHLDRLTGSRRADGMSLRLEAAREVDRTLASGSVAPDSTYAPLSPASQKPRSS